MRKKDSSSSIIDSFQTVESNPIKFDLFVKVRELKQIYDVLQQVLLMPKKQRQAWIDEHEDMINQLMESFLDDSTMAMDGLNLDEEAQELSVELVSHLRDTMNIISNIMSRKKRTAS